MKIYFVRNICERVLVRAHVSVRVCACICVCIKRVLVRARVWVWIEVCVTFLPLIFLCQSMSVLVRVRQSMSVRVILCDNACVRCAHACNEISNRYLPQLPLPRNFPWLTHMYAPGV